MLNQKSDFTDHKLSCEADFWRINNLISPMVGPKLFFWKMSFWCCLTQNLEFFFRNNFESNQCHALKSTGGLLEISQVIFPFRCGGIWHSIWWNVMAFNNWKYLTWHVPSQLRQAIATCKHNCYMCCYPMHFFLFPVHFRLIWKLFHYLCI